MVHRNAQATSVGHGMKWLGVKNLRSHLDDSVGGFPTHVMNRILVAQPVGAFHLEQRFNQLFPHYEEERTVSYMCHLQSSSVVFWRVET